MDAWGASVWSMSKAEILAELPRLSAEERDEMRRRLSELDDENADVVALARSGELAAGAVQPQADVPPKTRVNSQNHQ